MTMGLFLMIIYSQNALVFKAPIYNVVDNNWGWVNIHPMSIFFNCLTLLMKMIFKQNFKNYFGPIIIFSPIVTLSIIIK